MLKLKLLNERVSHRAVCVVEGASGKPYTFKRDTNSRFYFFETRSDDISVLQDEIDDLLGGPNAVSVLLDEDSFHLAQGESRRPLAEWSAPNFEDLEKNDLASMCEELGIPFDRRVSADSLKDRLRTYYLGQEHFYRAFDVTGTVDLPKPDIATDEPEAETALDKMCDEGSAELPNKDGEA